MAVARCKQDGWFFVFPVLKPMENCFSVSLWVAAIWSTPGQSILCLSTEVPRNLSIHWSLGLHCNFLLCFYEAFFCSLYFLWKSQLYFSGLSAKEVGNTILCVYDEKGTWYNNRTGVKNNKKRKIQYNINSIQLLPYKWTECLLLASAATVLDPYPSWLVKGSKEVTCSWVQVVGKCFLAGVGGLLPPQEIGSRPGSTGQPSFLRKSCWEASTPLASRSCKANRLSRSSKVKFHAGGILEDGIEHPCGWFLGGLG